MQPFLLLFKNIGPIIGSKYSRFASGTSLTQGKHHSSASKLHSNHPRLGGYRGREFAGVAVSVEESGELAEGSTPMSRRRVWGTGMGMMENAMMLEKKEEKQGGVEEQVEQAGGECELPQHVHRAAGSLEEGTMPGKMARVTAKMIRKIPAERLPCLAATPGKRRATQWWGAQEALALALAMLCLLPLASAHDPYCTGGSAAGSGFLCSTCGICGCGFLCTECCSCEKCTSCDAGRYLSGDICLTVSVCFCLAHFRFRRPLLKT